MRYCLFCSALILLISPVHIGAQAPAPGRAVLEGEVVNSVTGAAIPGARIKVEMGPDEPVYAKAGDGGRFVFSDLAPGSYRLFVESPGFLRSDSTSVSLPAPRQPGGGAPRGVMGVVPSGSVTLSTGDDGAVRAKAAIRLTPYAAIAGKITDPYGVPVADCMVEVQQAVPGGAMRSRSSLHTDDRGEFRAAPLEPGTYYVLVGHPHMLWTWESTFRTTYYPRALDRAAATPLELAAGQQVRADIRILRQAGVRVEGRTIKPPGQEISSGSIRYTQVALWPERATFLSVRSSQPFTSRGDEFELNEIMPGKYTLLAITRDSGTDPFGGNLKPLFGAMRQVEIVDHDMTGVDVALQPLRDIAGVVTFPEGCRAVPLRIRLQSQIPFTGGQVEAVSGVDGRFVLGGGVVGRFTLNIATKEGYQYPRVSSMRLGDRDVLKDGFEMPYSGDDSLRVGVDCPSTGRLP